MRIGRHGRLVLIVALLAPGCEGAVQRVRQDGASVVADDGPAEPPPPPADGAPPVTKDAIAPDLAMGGGECTLEEAALGGHCYRALGMGEMTYQMARDLCESSGAQAISIQSPEENQLAFDLLYMWSDCAWIGLTRLGGQSKLVWEDGSQISYDNWQAGEPDDRDCVCLRGPAADPPVRGQWRDSSCSSQLREIICERVP